VTMPASRQNEIKLTASMELKAWWPRVTVNSPSEVGGAALRSRRHVFVTYRALTQAQIQSDRKGGIPPGRWSHLEVKIGPSEISSSENSVQRITQTSLRLCCLQSTTCSSPGSNPGRACARGTVFWVDREARVQIAPTE